MFAVMDGVYSSSLLVALMAGVAALLLGVAGLRKPGGWWPSPRLTMGVVLLAAASLLTSVAVHWTWGHGRSSPEPMGVGPFLENHLAFLWTGLMIVGGLVLALRARGRTADGD